MSFKIDKIEYKILPAKLPSTGERLKNFFHKSIIGEQDIETEYSINIYSLLSDAKKFSTKTKKLHDGIMDKINAIHFANMLYEKISKMKTVDKNVFEINETTFNIPIRLNVLISNSDSNEIDLIKIRYNDKKQLLRFKYDMSRENIIFNIIRYNHTGMLKMIF